MSTATDLLKNLNGNTYNASTNPYGLDGVGGMDANLVAAFNAMGAAGDEVALSSASLSTAVSVAASSWDAATTAGNPGTGKMRASTATLTTGSYTLYINTTDSSGNDISALLTALGGSSSTIKARARLVKASDTTKYIDVHVTSASVSSGYATVAVTYLAGPAGFSASDAVVLGWVRTGDVGSQGPVATYWGGTAGGTANALTATTGASLSSLTAGQIVGVKVGASANSGAATLAVDSVSAIAIRKNGSALAGGELASGTDLWFQYDGTYWRLLGGSGGASGALWCGVATGTANALTLTPATALSAYSNGVSISFVTGASDNSGAVTVAVSGLSAVSLYSVSGFALNARDLKANTLYQATYYSGAFRLLGTPAAGSITTTGLVSRIDAGDSACYSTGQTLTNLVSVPADGAASSSYSWVRGASTSAGSDDPTFNGSSGGMSASEYFSTDGGDLLSLAAGSNTTWLDGLHKAGATGTIAAWIYPTGTFVIFGTCDQSNRPGVFFRVTPSGPETNFAVFGDAGLAAASPSTTTTTANAWSFVAISFAEGVTNGSFYYINGNYAQVSASNTFTLSYSSPSVNAANRKAAWFEYGTNTGGNTASGSRHAQGFLYNRALSKAELDAIFAATRARYGV